RFLGNRKALVGAALLLGIQPWTYEFSRVYYPDSLTAVFYTLGIISIWMLYATDNKSRRIIAQAAAGIFFWISFLLRGDMLLFSFVPLLVTMVIMVISHKERFFRQLGIAFSILFLFVLANFAYRYSFDRTIVARFVAAAPGLRRWLTTWVYSEDE